MEGLLGGWSAGIQNGIRGHHPQAYCKVCAKYDQNVSLRFLVLCLDRKNVNNIAGDTSSALKRTCIRYQMPGAEQ